MSQGRRLPRSLKGYDQLQPTVADHFGCGVMLPVGSPRSAGVTHRRAVSGCLVPLL